MEGLKLTPNKKLIIIGLIFLFAYFTPFDIPVVENALNEAFLMLAEYAREHILLCLVPAFFIAGAIFVFLKKDSVLKYLGPNANPLVAYTVASVSGAILAVCSCTVLPLFKGIYKKGAGLGPAVAFLYSGPAINILAIILTARVLGWEIGVARAVGAILFAFLIGLFMHLIFKKEDEQRVTNEAMFKISQENEPRTMAQTSLYIFTMVAILIFLTWSQSEGNTPVWDTIFNYKYFIIGGFGILLVFMLIKWFKKDEVKEWVTATRDFAIQILPLLFIGVFIAGFLLGRPGNNGIINEEWVALLVGGNSIRANLIASVAGAFMYIATITEVPILESLIGAGMGKGPALALLLAGPSLSLPSMLVILGELGIKKTSVYVGLVVVMSTLMGWVFGLIV